MIRTCLLRVFYRHHWRFSKYVQIGEAVTCIFYVAYISDSRAELYENSMNVFNEKYSILFCLYFPYGIHLLLKRLGVFKVKFWETGQVLNNWVYKVIFKILPLRIFYSIKNWFNSIVICQWGHSRSYITINLLVLVQIWHSKVIRHAQSLTYNTYTPVLYL